MTNSDQTISNSSQTSISIRLSIMMFIQFFVWGAWYVTVGNFMKKYGMADAIGDAYAVGPIAAIVSPFFLGMIADRFFASEKVLGIMHLLGGVVMFCIPLVIKDETASQSAFVGLLLLHMLFYMPTLGLTNTIAFHHITNQEKQFPLIRVLGTIGWIVAGVLVSKLLHADEKLLQFQITGGASILMGIFSFSLPHTPPPLKGKKMSLGAVIGIDSLKLMKDPSFAIFIVSSFLICIPLSAYYAFAPLFVGATGFKDPAYNMSFGQMSEIFFMLVMPLCFAKLGVKKMLLIGMFAWVARYGLFYLGAEDQIVWMIIGGILLHGICYDFFFVTGQIYVDKVAGDDIRGQAQGFLVFVTYGLGMFVGAKVSGSLFNKMITGEGAELLTQWKEFWLIPCIAAGVVMIVFGLFFKDKLKTETVTEGDVAAAATSEKNV